MSQITAVANPNSIAIAALYYMPFSSNNADTGLNLQDTYLKRSNGSGASAEWRAAAGLTDAALAAYAERMGLAVAHRGRDGNGLWTDTDLGLAFAHRRLAIIDLKTTGHQPMASLSGRYVISFNGEIYNFPELRAELEAQGIGFRGKSDTEV